MIPFPHWRGGGSPSLHPQPSLVTQLPAISTPSKLQRSYFSKQKKHSWSDRKKKSKSPAPHHDHTSSASLPPPTSITTTAVTAATTLPNKLLSASPSKLIRQIKSLQDKLEKETQKRIAAEERSTEVKIQLQLAQQELRREMRVSNNLIDEAKMDAINKMDDALVIQVESEERVASILESNNTLKIMCTEKIRNERHHWSNERKKNIKKKDSERSGYEAILNHMKRLHVSDQRKLSMQFTKELEKQKHLCEKATICCQQAEENSSSIVNDHLRILHELKANQKQVLKNVKRKADIEKKAAIKALTGEMSSQLSEVMNDLADEELHCDFLELQLTDSVNVRLKIKRERAIGRHGGSDKWPPLIVLWICELLVNGTSPTAVPYVLQTASSYLNGEEVKELPSVSFVRECRIVVQILNEMIAAYLLSQASSWDQVFFDGTTRRQQAFLTLGIGIKNTDGIVEPIIASSCIYPEDETSENQVLAIVEKVCAALND